MQTSLTSASSPPPFRVVIIPERKRILSQRGFDAETGKRRMGLMRFYLSSLLHHSCLYHAFALCPASESLSEPPVTTQP